MTTPESKAREIHYEGTGNLGQAIKDLEEMFWSDAHKDWPPYWKEFAEQLFADVIALKFQLTQALTLPEVTEDEIEKATIEYDESEFGNIRIREAFKAGVAFAQKKMRGE